MKKIKLSKKQFNSLNPKSVALSLWIDSDDIMVSNGEELIEMAKEDEETPLSNPTLLEALDLNLKDVSCNSFEVITIKDNELVLIDVYNLL
jgi:hypothetical protein